MGSVSTSDAGLERCKYRFVDDYSEGAHPQILEALLRSNSQQQLSYGYDDYCNEAKKSISAHFQTNEASIHFVPTGTSTNRICISCCLRPHEAIIAAPSGHIVDKEAGAIEATGHKIILADAVNGKLTPESILRAWSQNQFFPHMARPRLLYISNSTEIGTIYTKAELSDISKLCKKLNLILFLDGARIGVALSSPKNDLTLNDILDLTDIFWIGGTKAGALLGEAVVIKDKVLGADFPLYLKQQGALLAKGRVIGIQFCELFRSNLFFDLCAHANNMAKALSKGLLRSGYDLAAETETNQVFAILPCPLIERLKARYEFYVWEQRDDGTAVVRFVTSWATEIRQVEEFNEFLAELKDTGC